MSEVAPFITEHPLLTLDGHEVQCTANQIEHSVDQSSNDYDTFCGSYRSYGPAHELLTLTCYQSFEAGGLWPVVAPLSGRIVPFVLLPDSRVPKGDDNPEMSGEVRVPIVPFLTAPVGEANEITLELAIQGAPSYDPPVAEVVATGATAGIPGTWTPAGSTPPASTSDLIAGTPGPVSASPGTAWTTGQYVQTATAGTGGRAYWNGTAWVAGTAS